MLFVVFVGAILCAIQHRRARSYVFSNDGNASTFTQAFRVAKRPADADELSEAELEAKHAKFRKLRQVLCIPEMLEANGDLKLE